MSAFGEMLKNLRKERRVTQRDLATKIGVDFSYISKIETGALEPPSEALIIKMAQVLEVDSQQLILLARKVPEMLRETIVDDDLAAIFLRKVPSLTEDQRKRIKDVIGEEKE